MLQHACPASTSTPDQRTSLHVVAPASSSHAPQLCGALSKGRITRDLLLALCLGRDLLHLRYFFLCNKWTLI